MKRPIIDGFFLVLRHHRLVWWIFFVNLTLGFLASIVPRLMVDGTLQNSLYAKELSQRFDVTVFIELLSRPEISAEPWYAGSAMAGIIFLLYTLFISGGVLSVYRDDCKFGVGPFFDACGEFFWRMVRLALCSVIPFAVVMGLFAKLQSVSSRVSANATNDMQGFWMLVAGSFFCLLLILFVRAWFDLAQARAVYERVRGMFFLTWRSFMLALRNSPRLVLIYLFTTIVGVVLAACAWFIWLGIPHASFGKSWLLLEIFTLVILALRLWQRAATMLWYENYVTLQAPVVPVVPTPLPVVIVREEVLPEVPPSTFEGEEPAT